MSTRHATSKSRQAAVVQVTVPPVHRVPAHLARRFHQVCLGALSEITITADLTPLEYGALASIDEAPGIDQRRIAERLAIDAVSTGQVLTRLEQQGWIDRTVDPDDRRARRVTLTTSGLALRTRLRPLLGKAHDRILSGLSSDERAQLIDLLMRVVEANEPYARPGNGRRQPGQRTRREGAR
jgi:MarR family transcriptional regulator, temperature-dependent positive regulator of motility